MRVILFIPLLATTLVLTQARAAPAGSYGALILKVLKYDRAFPTDAKTATLLIVHDGTLDKECEGVLATLRQSDVQTQTIALNELDARTSDAFAIYLCSGVDANRVSPIAARKRLLSFSTDYGAVASGAASVGFEVGTDGAPKIVVNVARLKLEGHNLDSSMLAAVKIVRDIAGTASSSVDAASVPRGPIEFDSTMTPAEFVSGPSPQYTRQALQNRVAGEMTVKCIIAVTGEVRNCRVLKGLPYMNEAVVNAFERRRYKPATSNGKPVEVDYTFRVKLSLP